MKPVDPRRCKNNTTESFGAPASRKDEFLRYAQPLLYLVRVWGERMARFYEQYGFAILWSLTSALGIGLGYWLLVAVASYGGLLPAWADGSILATHDLVSTLFLKLVDYVEKRIQWFGALATLATFVFGLVTGIRQAKRQLPRRLMEFMSEQLSPVYSNSEALVAAVAYRSANVPHRTQLFRKEPLNRALNALGDPFRPRRRRSLDEAITEADKYIKLTQKRLTYLMDIRAHAQILRGAVRNAEPPKRSQADISSEDKLVEADFASAIEIETSRLAAAELRGLFRARLGNLSGALQDFRTMQVYAQDVFCTRGRARALRHEADILRRQAAGTNAALLRRARRLLNVADRLFDGRTLGSYDWCERGLNREAYGEVQMDLATIAGASTSAAASAFNAAISYFQLAGADGAGHCERVRERHTRL